MKVSDYLASFLAKEGIGHVFQIIGGASVHMVNSLAERSDITYVCVQHEQAGAMAAEAYARMTKNMGAAMATSGPGMTNLITGIACAYFDSIPAIYITGQVNTFESKQGRHVRQVGFQETEIVDMVKPITKYAVRVEDPKLIRYELEKAFAIARSGRQGPVLLDMPNDVQRSEIEPDALKKFNMKELAHDVDTRLSVARNVRKAILLLQQAKRPVIIAGGAIRYRDQVAPFLSLVRRIRVPVVSTWSGIDVVPYADSMYIGQCGVYGNRAANFAVQNSDCVIAFGTRLDTRITGGKPETFARQAKKIVIDIDRAELFKHRGLEPDLGICADVADVLTQFHRALATVKLPSYADWRTKTGHWKREYPAVLPEWRKRKRHVDPYVFIDELSDLADAKSVVVTDCGANLTWTIQAFRVKKGQRLFSAMGNSPMGYSMAAAIGASFALNKAPVICIIGDGGFQINIQDLETIAHYRIPVKVFILNSHSYAIIKQFQDTYFQGRYEGTQPSSGYGVPDFIKVAKAYGLSTFTISSHNNLRQNIRRAMQMRGPVICDVVLHDDVKIVPKLAFGKPIEELSPELPKEEFLAHMLIDPVR